MHLFAFGINHQTAPLTVREQVVFQSERLAQALRKDGHQKNVVDLMQSRDDLYDYLGYHDFEKKLDALFAKGK